MSVVRTDRKQSVRRGNQSALGCDTRFQRRHEGTGDEPTVRALADGSREKYPFPPGWSLDRG
jgi:hypothetical protein